MDEIVRAALQLGIGGIFAAMWWLERKDRTMGEAAQVKMTQVLNSANENGAAVLQVVRDNTAALERLAARLDRGDRESVPHVER